MNIKEAIEESLKTKKMIARRSISQIAFVPTNDPQCLIMLVDIKNRRLPGKGWQPSAQDLIADDWYLTDRDLPKFN